MSPINFGDRIPTGQYAVHSRFARAVNLTNGRDLVSIVNAEIGGGPINIVVSDFRIFGAADRDFMLSVEDDRFVFNGFTVRKDLVRIYDSSISLRKTDFDGFMSNLELFEKNLLQTAAPKSLAFLLDSTRKSGFSSGFENKFVGRMRRGAGEILEGDLAGGTRKIRGLGFGLTPSGDDFLSGFLLGCNVVEKICGRDLSRTKQTVYDNAVGHTLESSESRSRCRVSSRAVTGPCGKAGAVGGNLISNILLSLSREGRVFQAFGNLLRALACPDERGIKSCVESLLRTGETSGADTAVGFLTACRHLSAAKVNVLQRSSPCRMAKVVPQSVPYPQIY